MMDTSMTTSGNNPTKPPPPQSSESNNTPAKTNEEKEDDDGIIPKSLKHLSPTHKIDLFHRRTGKILSGDNAIMMKDLSKFLRDSGSHEYEPMIPPSGTVDYNDGVGVDGRQVDNVNSASNNSNIMNIPQEQQEKVRKSVAEGLSVLVAGGPYRGLIGKVEACLPGGWYLVSELFDEDEFEFDLVIKSCHLELVKESSRGVVTPRSSSSQNNRRGGGGELSFEDFVTKQFVAPLHRMKLRTKALEEEEKHIKQQLRAVVDGNADYHHVNTEGAQGQLSPKPAYNAPIPDTPDPQSLGGSSEEDSTQNTVQKCLSEMVQKVESQSCEYYDLNFAYNASLTDHPGSINIDTKVKAMHKERNQKIQHSSGIHFYRLQKQLKRVQNQISFARKEQEDFLLGAKEAEKAFASLVGEYKEASM